MKRRWARIVLLLMLSVGTIILTSCDTLLEDLLDPNRELRSALREVLPDVESFELVQIDDEPILANLEQHALETDGSAPIYVQLPVIDADGTITENFTWTVYAHDVRRFDVQEGGTPIYGVSYPVSDGAPVDVLTGPSMTFQGVPDLTSEGFSALLTEIDAAGGEFPYAEQDYQMSALDILGGSSWSELEGAYYGPKLAAASVIQGVRSLLEPVLAPGVLDQLLADNPANYVIYSHADAYENGLVHVEEDWPAGVVAPEAASVDGHDHDHAVTASTTLEPEVHAFESGFRTVNVVPVADDTVYDPDTGAWAITGWIGRMDAAVNRMDLFGVFANVHADHDGNADANNNRIIVRSEIPEYRVLTKTGKERLVPHASSGCGGAGTFRDDIRSLSNSTERYDNEYWLWSTQDNFTGGGCSYSQTIDLAPNGGSNCTQISNRNYGNCGAVGYIELRSGHTQDWTSYVVMHETGHALNGRHDNDNSGSTGESDNSQRCTFLGIFEFGITGPSIMSYAAGPATWCFAWTPQDGSPVRNVSGMASYLHGALDPQ